MTTTETVYSKFKMDIDLDGQVVDEISQGMMYAALAVTDNKEGTLKSVENSHPWEAEAVKTVTGSNEQAQKPLKDILMQDMNGLTLDHEFEVSGITEDGNVLDTRGYIAHNDEQVVLSLHCTTSAFDWMSNFDTKTSAWGLVANATSEGYFYEKFSDMMCCVDPENYKPRVHTGFYSNFLAIRPEIKKIITPYLQPTAPPRKFYIVGHSLGAGVATLAACYFMTKFDWENLYQSMVVVTSGSPRVCCKSMKELIDAKRKAFGPSVRLYRLVKGDDAVVTIPSKKCGFCHLVNPTMITDGGKILLHTKEDEDPPKVDLASLSKFKDLVQEKYSCDEYRDDETICTIRSYDRFLARAPKAFRDHMLDFYLKPVLRKGGLKYGSTRPGLSRMLSIEEEKTYATPKTLKQEDQETQQPKKQVHRTYVPKMFRKYEQIHVEPTYF